MKHSLFALRSSLSFSLLFRFAPVLLLLALFALGSAQVTLPDVAAVGTEVGTFTCGIVSIIVLAAWAVIVGSAIYGIMQVGMAQGNRGNGVVAIVFAFIAAILLYQLQTGGGTMIATCNPFA